MAANQPYQVIARKYRPQRFDDLIGQESVKTTIHNAISQARIAHGYIFSGQRGTGKTTVARILARCLNCEQGPTATPCGVCASCTEIAAGGAMDVIEIDAASNRGINEMRELRENVRFRPARDRYKVFIVDEAHMITNEAFNALLKTLEEPPEWVVFILCTTESHKIPVTIASRCQQFSFRSVDFEELVERLKFICGEEKVVADEEALAVIAQAGEGSVRDSLSALDQAIAACGTTLEGPKVRELLGRFSLEHLAKVSEALQASDAQAILGIVHELERNGQSLQHFCREMARYFRNLLVAQVAGAETRLIAASPAERQRLAQTAAGFTEQELTRYLQLTLDLFRDLQYSTQPRLHMELGMVRLVQAGRLKAIEDVIAGLGGAAPVAPVAPKAPPVAAPPTPRPAMAAPVAAPRPAPVVAPAAAPAASPGSGSLKARLYEALVEANQKFTADAVQYAAVSETANGVEILATAAEMFSLKNDKTLQPTVDRLMGKPTKITFVTGDPGAAAEPVEKKKSSDDNMNAEAEQRALDHPEVRRFQELFPGAQVRAVRDLSNY